MFEGCLGTRSWSRRPSSSQACATSGNWSCVIERLLRVIGFALLITQSCFGGPCRFRSRGVSAGRCSLLFPTTLCAMSSSVWLFVFGVLPSTLMSARQRFFMIISLKADDELVRGFSFSFFGLFQPAVSLVVCDSLKTFLSTSFSLGELVRGLKSPFFIGT